MSARDNDPTTRIDATPPGGVSSSNDLEMNGPSAPIALGDVVGGRYRIVARLGGGAMGDVYEAENVSIRLRVAIKILKPTLANDPVFRERFREEAQAIAAIEHPGVIRFLDLVVGTPTFLVMEHVRGPTLADVVRERRVGLGDALRIAARLCDALAAAHQVGVIHRDLKPTNVLLARGPDGVQPKLIDFGLAKVASRGDRTGLTRTGQVVGTPRYMAPEQITGGNVDARTDLYALGCLLYELLSGAAPFDGDEDLQVLYRQVHESPRPLEHAVPDLPPEVARLVVRLLEKDPRHRYGDAVEARLALEDALVAIGDGPELYPLDDEMSTTALRPGPSPAAHVGLAPRSVSPPSAAPAPAPALALATVGGSAAPAPGASQSGRSSRRRHRPHAAGGGRALDAAGASMATTSPLPATDPPPTPPRRRIVVVAAAALAVGVAGGLALARALPLGRGAGESSAGASTGSGALLLVSDPAGARVLVDDRPQPERTPTWVSGLGPGAHHVRFERDGAEPLEQTVRLAAGERAVVQVALPTPRRRVEVRSVPDGAQVYVDGRLVLGETPVAIAVAQDDFHEVRVVKAGYQTEVRGLTPDDTATQLVVTLQRETQPRGTLYVDANGAAEIWIDGYPTGHTTPSLGIHVAVGRHTVELRDGAGGRSAPAVVTVGQGETVRLSMGALVPAGGADPGDAAATGATGAKGAKGGPAAAKTRRRDFR
jgi:serine/threonine-protein kinase